MHPPSLSLSPPPLLPFTSPFLQDPSLSTYLKVRISCILIGMSIFRSPPPSFLWLWISSILQTNNNNKTTPSPPPHQLLFPFLNQYLPSANKSYNFLTVRWVWRRHIYLPLVTFFCCRSFVLAAWLLAKWRGWMAVKRRAIASPSESATLKNGRRLSDDSTAKTHTHTHMQTSSHTLSQTRDI